MQQKNIQFNSNNSYPINMFSFYDFSYNDFSSKNEYIIDNFCFDIITNNENDINSQDIFFIQKEKIENLNNNSGDIIINEMKDNFAIIDKIDKENIQRKIKEKIFSKKPFEEKKKLGRKIKSDECSGKHNKFSDDNILRKLKNAVLKNILIFINQRIKDMYWNLSKSSLYEMQLFKLKQKTSEKSNVKYNKNLLNSSLKAIFSEEISGKYTKHDPKHNKNLIEKLLKEKDQNKREYFKKIFGLTFMDCFNHFRGSIFFKELNGLKTFRQYLKELKIGKYNEYYQKVLLYYLNNYETEIKGKKERKRKRINKL